MNFKVILLSGLFIFYINYCYGAATVDQMRDASKLMRDVCQPKFKLSNEIADGIKGGKLPDDKQVKCYINCILEMAQFVKKGKLNYDTTMKQIDIMVPDELKDEYRKGVQNCINAADGVKNPCEVSYLILKCFMANVQSFIFP